MIKKITKVIFENEEDTKTEELIGGIPLSKGETVVIHKKAKEILYEVSDKKVDFFLEGDDQTVNITYTLRTK